MNNNNNIHHECTEDMTRDTTLASLEFPMVQMTSEPTSLSLDADTQSTGSTSEEDDEEETDSGEEEDQEEDEMIPRLTPVASSELFAGTQDETQVLSLQPNYAHSYNTTSYPMHEASCEYTSGVYCPPSHHPYREADWSASQYTYSGGASDYTQVPQYYCGNEATYETASNGTTPYTYPTTDYMSQNQTWGYDPSLPGAMYDPQYGLPGSHCEAPCRSVKKRRRVPTSTQRQAANIRERRRMFSLNESFDELRKHVPTFAYEKKLSRIETLRLAITYIAFMSDVARGVDPTKVRLVGHHRTSWSSYELSQGASYFQHCLPQTSSHHAGPPLPPPPPVPDVMQFLSSD